MNSTNSAAIGACIEQAARSIAPVLVAVYVAGFTLGTWLHQLNHHLAATYLAALGLQQSPPPPAVQPQQQQHQAPAPAPLPTTVEGLRFGP